MKLFGLGKVKHRKYNYEPRYFDPVKEEVKKKLTIRRAEKDLEARVAQENEEANVETSYSDRISYQYAQRQKQRNATALSQVIMMVMFVFFTCLLIFFTEYYELIAIAFFTAILGFFMLKRRGIL